MSSVNKVIIIGNLGQDPELRATASQQSVANFSVATSEKFTKDGQSVENTEWHRIVVWGKQAENVAQYLTKGSKVYIEGKLQTRNWQDNNGVEKYTTEINAFNVTFLDSKNQRESLQASDNIPANNPQQQAPQQHNQPTQQAPQGQGQALQPNQQAFQAPANPPQALGHPQYNHIPQQSFNTPPQSPLTAQNTFNRPPEQPQQAQTPRPVAPPLDEIPF